MNAWRMRPPATLQGSRTCWAAAISSFGRMIKGVPDWSTPGAVVAHFKAEFSSQMNADDSLKTPSGVIAFADKYGLKVEEIRINHPINGSGVASAGVKSLVANELKASHFVPKLQSSHVLVVRGHDNDEGLSHVVVVYGADNLRLAYMNPASDPELAMGKRRAAGGSGRVDKNWFVDTYEDFMPGPRYLLVWRP